VKAILLPLPPGMKNNLTQMCLKALIDLQADNIFNSQVINLPSENDLHLILHTTPRFKVLQLGHLAERDS